MNLERVLIEVLFGTETQPDSCKVTLSDLKPVSNATRLYKQGQGSKTDTK